MNTLPFIYLDTETHLIRPGQLAPPLVSLALALDSSPVDLIVDRTEQEATARAILDTANPSILVGQNIPYDLAVLVNTWPDLLPAVFRAYAEGRVRDTMIRQRLLDIAAGKVYASASLAACAAVHLGRHLPNKKAPKALLAAAVAGDMEALAQLPPRFRYELLAGVPLEEWPADAIQYAADDVIVTRDVFLAQGPALMPGESDQCRAAWALHLMAVWGVLVDQDSVDQLDAALTATVSTLDANLVACGFMRDKVVHAGKDNERTDRSKNTKAIKAAVVRALGDDSPTAPAGGIKTDKATLEQAAQAMRVQADKAKGRAARFLGWAADGLETLTTRSGPAHNRSTYIPALRRGRLGPVNARYSVLKATGRTSCADPNMQNLPRKGGFRECFVARPGMVWIACDYTAIEMVSLAQVNLILGTGRTMADALNSGTDPHCLVGSQLAHVSYEDFYQAYMAGAAWAGDLRQHSKVANYGFPGGMGAASFMTYARDNGVAGVDINQARKLKRLFLSTWPEMPGFFAHIADLVGDDTGTITVDIAGLVRGDVQYCAACNTKFQGLTAAGAKAAAWAVAWECYMEPDSPLFGFRLVVFVHDEIIIEGPEDRAEVARARLGQVMREAMQPYMPDMVIRTESKHMKRWTK